MATFRPPPLFDQGCCTWEPHNLPQLKGSHQKQAKEKNFGSGSMDISQLSRVPSFGVSGVCIEKTKMFADIFTCHMTSRGVCGH